MGKKTVLNTQQAQVIAIIEDIRITISHDLFRESPFQTRAFAEREESLGTPCGCSSSKD
jgi:hypothetical protein